MNYQSNSRRELPQPPEMQRKFKLYPYQYIGIPLLFLIPILALLGVFGVNNATASAVSADLHIEVQYPITYRYKMIQPLEVTVENTSDQTLATLTVEFSRVYIDHFSNVAFTPQVERITDAAYVVELPDVQPGERRVISIEIQAEDYGQVRGVIRAAAAGVAPVETAIETMVFP